MANKEISEQQVAFLDAYFGEAHGNVRAAMDAAGYSRRTTEASVLAALKDEIREGAKTRLLGMAVRAVDKAGAVMEDGTLPGGKVALAAASQILDRAGIVTKQEVSVVAEPGIFILPPKANDRTDEEEED